jgi:hypothetical protein
MPVTVDGGHRAIKYSRLSGVKKDIYSEGTTHPQPIFFFIETYTLLC